MEGQISVLIADSQPLLSDALASAMRETGKFDVLEASPSSGSEALEAISNGKPDVVFLDFWLPRMEGPLGISRGLARHPKAKIVALGWLYVGLHIEQALAAGAVGFISKSITLEDLIGVAVSVCEGAYPIYAPELEGLILLPLPDLTTGNFSWRGLEKLTEQELRILEQLGTGKTRSQIAETLSVRPATLRTHIDNILKKTGARSQVEAVAWGRRLGLIRS